MISVLCCSLDTCICRHFCVCYVSAEPPQRFSPSPEKRKESWDAKILKCLPPTGSYCPSETNFYFEPQSFEGIGSTREAIGIQIRVPCPVEGVSVLHPATHTTRPRTHASTHACMHAACCMRAPSNEEKCLDVHPVPQTVRQFLNFPFFPHGNFVSSCFMVYSSNWSTYMVTTAGGHANTTPQTS